MWLVAAQSASAVQLVSTIPMAARAGDGGAGGLSVDVTAIIEDVLVFFTLLAAVVALRYARDSARAAQATVKPLEEMASNLTTAASTLKDLAASLAGTTTMLKDMENRLAASAEIMKTTLGVAERGRQEDRLVHRLGQYERVFAAVTTMQRAYGPFSRQERESWTREGQGLLRAAVAPLPPDELPECRRASEAPVSDGYAQGGVADAQTEITDVIRVVRHELDELLERAGP